MRSETELIELIQRLARSASTGGLRVGIGDDAAVLAPPPVGFEQLVTTDQIVENRHFIRGQHPPEALGHKLMVRGLSDIAAMGGEPSWALLSLTIPENLGDAWTESFVEGFLGAKLKSGVGDLALAGGDVSGGDRFAAHIVVSGTAPAGQTLLRSGASAGDLLYVSGELGGSALGLERLADHALDDPAVARHLWPSARLQLGGWLRESGCSAALDVSDGLSADLQRLAIASGVGVEVEFETLPRFRDATDIHVLHGGEEYELLFTVAPSHRLPQSFQGVRLTPIGKILDEGGVSLVREGRSETLPDAGYEHLRGD